MNVFVVIKFKLLLYFNNNKRPVLVCYYSNNKHNNPYIGACRLEQVVICAQYLEFRAAVDLVGDLLLLGGQLLDELLCQHVALFQEVVLFGHALVDRFRDALAIAFGLQAVHGDAAGDQVIDDRLRPSLRQSLVVFVRSVWAPSSIVTFGLSLSILIISSSASFDSGRKVALSKS